MKLNLLCIVLYVLANTTSANAQTVTLDYFFNRETRTGKDGKPERFHYLWEDKGNTGFSIWGDIFLKQGATLATLEIAPTIQNLKNTSVYIIVDPDSKKENPSPNYIQKEDADQIAKWVKAGGVLVLMANDSANAELTNFNTLAGCFGLHFNNDLQNHVVDDAHFDDGALKLVNDPIFTTTAKPFLKDVCSIALSGKATPALKATNGSVIAATVKYGKGTVFAVGDPWLYNEYVNGRLHADFDNDKAADDLVVYLLKQARKTTK